MIPGTSAGLLRAAYRGEVWNREPRSVLRLEWRVINGTLSALRWVLGDEVGMLDT
jgi:hypothetical protein